MTWGKNTPYIRLDCVEKLRWMLKSENKSSMNSHARFLKLGLDTNPIIATRLLNSYITSTTPSQQSLTYAHQLFEQVPLKDTTLWTSIISAYTRAGNSHKALHLFSQMLLLQSRPLPNHYVYATVARACCGFGSSSSSINSSHLQLGQTIHARVIKTGFLSNVVVVETSFLDMYAKCGLMESARKMFVEMPQRNVISWNAMIAGYLLNGMEVEGLELFYRMKCVEFEKPDEYTIATVLAACARINDFKLGMQVHANLFKVGFEKECTSAICNMYFRGGQVLSAERVFTEHGKENALLKLIMIKGYVFNGRHNDALQFLASNSNFVKLVEADNSVISSVLTACADLSLLRIGRQVHGLIVALLSSCQTCQSEDGDDVAFIESSLINMYCKCYSVVEARRVCDNLLSVQSVSHWNSIITGYIFNGLLKDARRIFEEMTERNVVSWTAVISGYVQCGLSDEALRLLAKFYNHEDGLRIQGNCFTLTTALEACSHMTELNLGKQIHAKLIRTMVTADCNNPFVETALVDMYSKSGSLNYAERMFDRIMDRNVVSWTSMITGYAIHGLGSRVLQTFKQMLEMGIEPNEVTFVSVLNACSHCGLVDVGMQYFKLMRDKYGIVPRGDHYACVIDLLGRAGKFTEAWSLLEKFKDEEAGNEFYAGSIRGALLGACRLHGNVEMGSRVAEKMLEKKHQVPDTYITLSNVYAIAGMWHESYKVRERWRSEGGVVREPGQSRIHTNLVIPILAEEKLPVLTVDR